MQRNRSTAVKFAIILFFFLAIVGWLTGASPATCCSRAFGGAVIIYLVIRLAAKAVNAIILNQIVNYKVNKMAEKSDS